MSRDLYGLKFNTGGVVPIHAYKIIEDFEHTKSIPIYVSTTIWERIFFPNLWVNVQS